ncbi:MAG: hypothetical protein HY924_07635 [Elusimicrobia bacterium]|nr:hypothetical protein [Elusimicrobiota bacterium]
MSGQAARTAVAAFLLSAFLPGSARGGSTAFEAEMSAAISDFSGRASAFARTARRAAVPAAEIPPAPASAVVEVADPWTDANRRLYYGWTGKPSTGSRILNGLILENPLVPAPLLAPLLDRFPEAQAREIAGRCKERWASWWDRIGCVSTEVHAALKGKRYRLPATPCKTHALAFNEAFAALGLGSARSMSIDGSGAGPKDLHVVNAALVQDDAGRVFTYVIDSGWFPGKLFPMNDLAIRLHDRDRDDRTDFQGLPEIREHPATAYLPSDR